MIVKNYPFLSYPAGIIFFIAGVAVLAFSLYDLANYNFLKNNGLEATGSVVSTNVSLPRGKDAVIRYIDDKSQPHEILATDNQIKYTNKTVVLYDSSNPSNAILENYDPTFSKFGTYIGPSVSIFGIILFTVAHKRARNGHNPWWWDSLEESSTHK